MSPDELSPGRPEGEAQEPVDHVVVQGRSSRVLRWALAVFAGYNTVAHLFGGRWWLALAWGAGTALLVVVQLVPQRLGTRVEPDGVRLGTARGWGELISWDDVDRLVVASRYEQWGWLVRRDGRRLPLRGMTPDAVRALAADRSVPIDDPASRAAAAAGLSLPGASDAASEAGPGAGPDGRPDAGSEEPDAAKGPMRPVLPEDDGPLDGPFRTQRRPRTPPS
ncbi:hypothetical protein SAMN06264364_14017 [Quadrisphaera granulorum]|uniref:PH (Pleckstrin Homology) domain-containing protein n=1 Tax=Quadrisphaera granulorum TaxID=317664 RepID=A0A315ZQ27_9ACTN|nr:hypothetical protein [Quadrisphaera granulorum]PWJ47203.1 hypothetical protein BXY45_14017 [Quadrisphaera granulorum]SZE98889.1 hypothetical protein SAMN06264364_14017 [Quadrisphaera granulorum]